MTAWDAELRAAVLEAEGFPASLGVTEASFVDDTTKDAIPRLCRSAVEVGSEWGPAMDGFDRPAVVFAGVDDTYVGAGVGERMARRLGARFVAFEGCGHGWPIARVADAATELRRLWESAG